MYKIIATSIVTLALATSAFAQGAAGGGAGQSSFTDSQAGSGGTVQTQKPMDPAPKMGTDSTTTNSTTGTNASGGAAGLSGTSAAGTNGDCPAGTPGAGVNSAPKGDIAATNPACNSQ